jgi:hypothetical protein
MAVDLNLAAPARDVLSVRCEAIDDGRAARTRRYLRALVAILVSYPGRNDSGPAVPAFLIVDRTDTGEELLRLRSDLQDAPLLEHVRGHIESLTVGEFCRQWGVDLPYGVPAQ